MKIHKACECINGQINLRGWNLIFCIYIYDIYIYIDSLEPSQKRSENHLCGLRI